MVFQMESKKIYNWEKLDDNREFTRKYKDKIFLLRKSSYGVLGIGKCFQLYAKGKDETEFQYVTSIVYDDDNHGLQLHEYILKNITKDKYFDIDKHINLIFEVADKYIEKLF